MPLINKLYFRFRNFFSINCPKLYGFCNDRKSVVKFFIAGSLAGASDLIFLFIFHGLMNMGIVAATSLAFILSFLVSFTLQKFWTFRNYSQKGVARQLVLYIANAFIGLNMNGWFMHLLVNKYGVWYILAQIIVNLVLGFYNFLVYKFIVFNKTDDENSHQQKELGGSAGNLA